jgi:hypothetical protein
MFCRTDHCTPLYPQNLALNSPTGDSRSVGIVRLSTKSHGVCCFGVRCFIAYVANAALTLHQTIINASGQGIKFTKSGIKTRWINRRNTMRRPARTKGPPTRIRRQNILTTKLKEHKWKAETIKHTDTHARTHTHTHLLQRPKSYMEYTRKVPLLSCIRHVTLPCEHTCTYSPALFRVTF